MSGIEKYITELTRLLYCFTNRTFFMIRDNIYDIHIMLFLTYSHAELLNEIHQKIQNYSLYLMIIKK